MSNKCQVTINGGFVEGDYEQVKAVQKAIFAQERLNNLLCIIHRDGGHRIQKVGQEKAYQEAINILCEWRDK